MILLLTVKFIPIVRAKSRFCKFTRVSFYARMKKSAKAFFKHALAENPEYNFLWIAEIEKK